MLLLLFGSVRLAIPIVDSQNKIFRDPIFLRDGNGRLIKGLKYFFLSLVTIIPLMHKVLAFKCFKHIFSFGLHSTPL